MGSKPPVDVGAVLIYGRVKSESEVYSRLSPFGEKA